MQKALVVSLLVHAAVLAGARPIAAQLAHLVPPDPAALEPDRWTGTSIEVSTGTDALPGAEGPSPGAAQPSPAAAPNTNSTSDPPNTAPPAPASSSAPAASTTAAASAIATARPLAPTATSSQKPKPPRRPRRASRPATSASASASAAASSAPSASPVASSGDSTGTGSGSGNGGTFGSEGKASVRDLGRAFTRAIPAACSADPVWSKLAAGDAGTLRVELRIDAEGHIAGAEPVGEDPPKHLVNILRRTVPLLQAGTFAVKGSTPTAGTQTLELKAIVSDEPAGDEDPGARDKLAFSYEGGRGKASFTQTGGRRVDVSVRVVSVQVGD